MPTLRESLDARSNKSHACCWTFPAVIAGMTGIAMVAFKPRSVTITGVSSSPLLPPPQVKLPYPKEWHDWIEIDPWAVARLWADACAVARKEAV